MTTNPDDDTGQIDITPEQAPTSGEIETDSKLAPAQPPTPQRVSCARCGKKWFEPAKPEGYVLCPICEHLASSTAPERESLSRAQAHCKTAAVEMAAAASAVRAAGAAEYEMAMKAGIETAAEAVTKAERVAQLYDFLAVLLTGDYDDTIRVKLAETVYQRKMFAQMAATSVETDPLGHVLLLICQGEYDDAIVRLLDGGPL